MIPTKNEIDLLWPTKGPHKDQISTSAVPLPLFPSAIAVYQALFALWFDSALHGTTRREGPDNLVGPLRGAPASPRTQYHAVVGGDIFPVTTHPR